jgi:hypothetical protein
MIQLVVGIVLCVLFAQVWIAYWPSVHLVVCGLLLHAYAVLLTAQAARDLYMIGSIDYSASVVHIQKRLAQLYAWRVRVAPIYAITGCVVWIPLMLVIFRALGVDVWQRQPSVVYWFLASGALCLLVLAGLHTYVRRPARAALARSMDDSTAGRSVIRAQSALAEIAQFESEGSA